MAIPPRNRIPGRSFDVAGRGDQRDPYDGQPRSVLPGIAATPAPTVAAAG